jgi:hypothetical protein
MPSIKSVAVARGAMKGELTSWYNGKVDSMVINGGVMSIASGQ